MTQQSVYSYTSYQCTWFVCTEQPSCSLFLKSSRIFLVGSESVPYAHGPWGVCVAVFPWQMFLCIGTKAWLIRISPQEIFKFHWWRNFSLISGGRVVRICSRAAVSHIFHHVECVSQWKRGEMEKNHVNHKPLLLVTVGSELFGSAIIPLVVCSLSVSL